MTIKTDTQTARVVEAFGKKSRTVAEVAEALDMSERAVRGAIDSARRAGVHFRRVGQSTFTTRAAGKGRARS